MSPEKRAAVMQATARKVRFETIKHLCDSNSFYRQRRRDPEFAAAADQWLVDLTTGKANTSLPPAQSGGMPGRCLGA